MQKIETELNKNQELEKISNQTKVNIIKAQESFQRYLISKEDTLLVNYKLYLKKIANNLDDIHTYSLKNPNFQKVFLLNDSVNIRKSRLDKLVDSLSNVNLFNLLNNDIDNLKINNYNYKDVLNSINIETYIEIDSVQKKGLLSRLGNAISGKVDVQKEKVKVLITMKYGKKVITGNIEEQLSNAFRSANNYFSDEILDLRNELLKIKSKEKSIFYQNEELILLSMNLSKIYEKAIFDHQNALKLIFKNQNSKNKNIRKIVVFGLIILMFILSLILAYLTYFGYEYEKRLNFANETINKSLNLKERILGMLSHELRAPLNIMSIYIKKIIKSTQEESVKNILNTMYFTSNSLLLLSNQILDYVKNQDNKISLNSVEFNLKNEIDNILESLRTLVESKDNKLIFENNFKEDIIINSDRIKIQQLFLNLIGNANKFTEKGVIKIRTYALNQNEKSIRFEVMIEDNGIGISKKDLEKIYAPFYQGKNSGEVENIGAGLGLNLCKEIIELFNGDIEISSKKNIGTKVKFCLILEKLNIAK